MRVGLRLALSLLALVAIVATRDVGAQPIDEAPPECRAQVLNALKEIAPAYAKKASRKIAAGAPGSIEHAIRAYAPPRFHPVSEGSLPSVKSGTTCPTGMANVLERFCVDKWEGTLVEKNGDGSEVAFSPFRTPQADHVYIAKTAAGVIPQGYVSPRIAEAACKQAGKRLCHPVEWRTACAGSEGYAFGYGPTRIANKCHDTGASPMVAYHADTMKRGWGLVELNDPRNNQVEGGIGKTGQFPDCTNDFGVYDMVGNLSEWTADTNGTFQGGLWLDTAQHGDACAYRTISHGYGYHDYSTGFRCCADPQSP